jgi:hypothetical protein
LRAAATYLATAAAADSRANPADWVADDLQLVGNRCGASVPVFLGDEEGGRGWDLRRRAAAAMRAEGAS